MLTVLSKPNSGFSPISNSMSISIPFSCAFCSNDASILFSSIRELSGTASPLFVDSSDDFDASADAAVADFAVAVDSSSINSAYAAEMSSSSNAQTVSSPGVSPSTSNRPRRLPRDKVTAVFERFSAITLKFRCPGESRIEGIARASFSSSKSDIKTLSLFLSILLSLSNRIVVVVRGGIFTFFRRVAQLVEQFVFSCRWFCSIRIFKDCNASKGEWSVKTV